MLCYPGPLPPHACSVMPLAPRRSKQQFPLLLPHPPSKTSISRSLVCQTRTRNFLLPQLAVNLLPKMTLGKPPRTETQTQHLRNPRKSRWKLNHHPLPTLPSLLSRGGSPNLHPPRSMSLVRSDLPPRLYPQEAVDPSATFPPELLLPKALGCFPPLHFLLPVTRQLSPYTTEPKIPWISGLALVSLLHLERTKRSRANSYPPPRGPSCRGRIPWKDLRWKKRTWSLAR